MKKSPINATKFSIHIAMFVRTHANDKGIESKVTIEIFSQNR